jgi:ElaB/YqjD/DUF883 family membrane-anchored ribosome-binding protein
LAAAVAIVVGSVLTLSPLVGPGWATLIVVAVALGLSGIMARLAWLHVKHVLKDKGMSGPPDITIAEARVRLARARLFGTIGEVQDRLKPSNLAQDAVESAAQGVASVARKGAEAVRARPFAAAAITGAIGLVMARGWIGDILGKRHETRDPATGLKPKGKKGSS